MVKDDHALTLTDLYNVHEAALYRYASGLSQDPQYADDLVQDTMVRAMAHLGMLGRLNRPERLAWLKRVLKNRFIDQVRAQKREERMIAEFVREIQLIIKQVPADNSHELLEQLSRADQNLLNQRYVLAKNSTEIGQELGIPAATVRSRLYAAIKRLRKIQIEPN